MVYKDKVVVITGGANGIGRVLAITYAEHGAKTVVLDRDLEMLNKAGEFIKNTGNPVWLYQVDLTEPKKLTGVFQEIENSLQRVDVLINNAGLGVFKPMEELSVEEWDYVIDTNLRGTFLCSREAAKLMKKQGSGTIVNISSTRALMSEPNTEAYSASKGGIVALTHAMAISLGSYKIRVNAISPGWIETGKHAQLKPEDHRQHPAGRVGKPEDIARACLYLTDPGNDFVTGVNLVVDGGMTRKMIYEE